MNPPTSGPTMLPRPKTLMIRPIHRPRSLGEKISPTEVAPSAIMAPPPIPVTARAAISALMFWEKPDTAEPSRNRIRPEEKKGPRPKRAERLPTTGKVTEEASMHEEKNKAY